jgi:hypothetical protein
VKALDAKMSVVNVDKNVKGLGGLTGATLELQRFIRVSRLVYITLIAVSLK